MKTRNIQTSNRSGISGVSWNTAAQKWKVYIQIETNPIYLGQYADFFEACCVRKSAENKYNFISTTKERIEYKKPVITNPIDAWIYRPVSMIAAPYGYK